jgi:hypothetical protein
MSRLLLACSFLAALSTTTLADSSAPSFSRPPPGWSDVDAPRDIARARPLPMPSRAAVRAKLLQVRAANLAHFRAYQRKGVFPSNTHGGGKLNVWRDEAGNLCAAATIIQASGQADLVARIADQDNFIRLGDVTSGPVMDWILTSGFTQEEIAAIQEPFEPVSEPVYRPRMPRPEPSPIVAVNPRLRRAEDLRLARKYREVEAMLVKNQSASIELAVDRLMATPWLARRLVRN